jgi:hypothetical protein
MENRFCKVCETETPHEQLDDGFWFCMGENHIDNLEEITKGFMETLPTVHSIEMEGDNGQDD